MSAEKPEKLLSQWVQNELPVERAIGQLLQLLIALYKRLDKLQEQLTALQQPLPKRRPKAKK